MEDTTRPENGKQVISVQSLRQPLESATPWVMTSQQEISGNLPDGALMKGPWNHHGHECEMDERGMCEMCETLKRDEGLMLRGWAAGVIEETRVKMVKGVMSMEEPEVWEMDWKGMMEEMANV